MTDGNVDLWDIDAFARGEDLDRLARLQQRGAVVWHDSPRGEPFWAVTRQAQARAILRDPETFSSATALGGMFLRGHLDNLPAPPEGVGQAMIETDPPRHQPQRRVLSPQFTQRSIAKLATRVREVTVDCVERAREMGKFDFVTEVAHVIPATVTFELLGVPKEDWPRLAELEHQFLGTAMVDADAPARTEPIIEMATYFYNLLSEKERAPGDDLLDLLLSAPVEGEQRSVIDLIGESVLLVNGGLDTTRAAASGGGLLPLLRDPQKLRDLRADRALLPDAVEEFVRWAAPIRHVARTATCDCVIGDVSIKAGDRVAIWIAACNRDDLVFERPEVFDVARHPNPHLGFSFGEHFCLGTHLARLILRIQFDEILERWPRIELAGEPEGVHSNFVGGLHSLPVRVRS